MKYMFFDTAINGFYSLIVLKKEFSAWKPLMPEEERILDDAAPFLFETDTERLAGLSENPNISLQKIVVFESSEAITAIQIHYRQFVVQNIKGRPFYFRFWAADVLKKYLTTCDARQLKNFFGSVETFIVADDDPAFSLHYSFDGKKLLTDKVPSQPGFTQAKETAVVDAAPAAPIESKDNFDPSAEEKRPPRRYFY